MTSVWIFILLENGKSLKGIANKRGGGKIKRRALTRERKGLQTTFLGFRYSQAGSFSKLKKTENEGRGRHVAEK